jgi:uncharacterized protein (DUF305 family)
MSLLDSKRSWAWLLVLASVPAMSCRSSESASARPQIIQPGAPGQASRVVDAAAAADLSRVAFTAADVRFMQGMIGHHAQALDMTALVPAHSSSDAIRKLAQRIAISQADEIKMMQEWLTRRGQKVPGEHAHHAPGAPLMPGMLTAEDMARLAQAKGPEFDRLFLEFMIRHHEGALTMVQDLFAQPGRPAPPRAWAWATRR